MPIPNVHALPENHTTSYQSLISELGTRQAGVIREALLGDEEERETLWFNLKPNKPGLICKNEMVMVQTLDQQFEIKLCDRSTVVLQDMMLMPKDSFKGITLKCSLLSFRDFAFFHCNLYNIQGS